MIRRKVGGGSQDPDIFATVQNKEITIKDVHIGSASSGCWDIELTSEIKVI